MHWYVIDIPQDSITDGRYHRLCRRFQQAFIEAGAPIELALFATRGSESARRLFLSPLSSTYVPELLRGYGAKPCDVPDASTVTLVYGVPGAQTLLASLESPPGEAEERSRGYPVLGASPPATR